MKLKYQVLFVYSGNSHTEHLQKLISLMLKSSSSDFGLNAKSIHKTFTEN